MRLNALRRENDGQTSAVHNLRVCHFSAALKLLLRDRTQLLSAIYRQLWNSLFLASDGGALEISFSSEVAEVEVEVRALKRS